MRGAVPSAAQSRALSHFAISSRVATILGARTALSARFDRQRETRGQGCPRYFGSGLAWLRCIAELHLARRWERRRLALA